MKTVLISLLIFAASPAKALEIIMDTCQLILCPKQQMDKTFDNVRKRCMIVYGEDEKPVREDFFDFDMAKCERGPVVKSIDRRPAGPRVPEKGKLPTMNPDILPQENDPNKALKLELKEQLKGVDDAIEVSEYKLKVCPNKDAILSQDCGDFVDEDKEKCDDEKLGITALCVKNPFDKKLETAKLKKLRKTKADLELKRAQFP